MKNSIRQQGFSLLEILVAFSILALSLGIILNIFSTGLRTAIISEEYIQATAIAESLLAKTGTEFPLEETNNQGIDNDKYHWRIEILPFTGLAGDFDAEQFPVNAFRVDISVTWQEGKTSRSMVLTTLKLTQPS